VHRDHFFRKADALIFDDEVKFLAPLAEFPLQFLFQGLDAVNQISDIPVHLSPSRKKRMPDRSPAWPCYITATTPENNKKYHRHYVPDTARRPRQEKALKIIGK
jgi:hypothetical protein